MLARGNGRPEQCVANLLRIIRSEVPYERLKGLDARLIDRPGAVVTPEIQVDTQWVLRTYEPRAKIETIDVETLEFLNGHFSLNVGITNQGR